MNKLKVIDNEDLVRDPQSKAILNVNVDRLTEHRRKKELITNMIKTAKKTERLEQQIINIESDVQSIKQMLIKLTEKV